MNNIAHIVRAQSMVSSGVSSSALPLLYSRDGDVREVMVIVQLTEDPMETANFVSISLFGALMETDTSAFTYGTFDENETAFNIGDGNTLAWSWSEPATGTFYASLFGVPMMPVMGVSWAATTANIADVWIQW